MCLPEPLRGVSLDELSLEEDSFDELSFEVSFDVVSDFGLSSFFSFEPESLLLVDPCDEDFLA